MQREKTEFKANQETREVKELKGIKEKEEKEDTRFAGSLFITYAVCKS